LKLIVIIIKILISIVYFLSFFLYKYLLYTFFHYILLDKPNDNNENYLNQTYRYHC
jgi:hypothetical protein